jgi:hypothetical protein
MSRATKLLVQLGLIAVLLFSFGAIAYDPGLDSDGDENMGVAVVLSATQSSSEETGFRSERVPTLSTATRSQSSLRALASYTVRVSAPLALLGSPHLIVPLRP